MFFFYETTTRSVKDIRRNGECMIDFKQFQLECSSVQNMARNYEKRRSAREKKESKKSETKRKGKKKRSKRKKRKTW